MKNKYITANQTHPSPPLSGREHSDSSPDKGRLGGVFSNEDKQFFFIPYNSKLKIYARENRKNPTQAEKRMWNILSRKQFINLKFTRQKPIDNFIADFYCAQLLLIIEIDGDTHSKQEAYDTLRSEILKQKYTIEVIRYNNSDVLGNSDEIYIDLLQRIKERKQIFKNPV